MTTCIIYWGGHSYRKFIYGCHTCVKIAIYVLKTKFLNTTVSSIICSAVSENLNFTKSLNYILDMHYLPMYS